MKRIISILMILIFSVSLLSACGKNKNDEEQFNFKGEITTYMYTPDSMNPLATAYKTNARVLSMMYSPLFKVKSDLTLEPVVALCSNLCPAPKERGQRAGKKKTRLHIYFS